MVFRAVVFSELWFVTGRFDRWRFCQNVTLIVFEVCDSFKKWSPKLFDTNFESNKSNYRFGNEFVESLDSAFKLDNLKWRNEAANVWTTVECSKYCKMNSWFRLLIEVYIFLQLELDVKVEIKRDKRTHCQQPCLCKARSELCKALFRFR